MTRVEKGLAIVLGLLAIVLAILFIRWLRGQPVGGTQIFTCPYCGAEFPSEAKLLAHIEQQHPPEPPLPPPPPIPPTQQSIGIFYIWHYSQDYNANWKATLKPGLNIATTRLSNYFGISWPYSMVAEFQTSYPTGNGNPVDRNCEYAAAESGLGYSAYETPIFVFANTREAYSVNYQPPIYMSDKAILTEENQTQTLIEHEIMHIFGLPDHNAPHTKPMYDNCIMGNLYLGKIVFCSECLAKLRERF